MSILTINPVNPTVTRPFRLADLQAVWDGLNSALATYNDGQPHILSGFERNTNGTYAAGTLAYNGKLYYYPADSGDLLVDDSSMYVKQVAVSNRTFGNGTVTVFDYANVITTSPNGQSIGTVTQANIAKWRTPFIGAGTITGEQIADNALEERMFGNECIPAGAFQDQSVSQRALQRNSVGELQIQDDAIPLSKLQLSAAGMLRPSLLAAAAVNVNAGSLVTLGSLLASRYTQNKQMMRINVTCTSSTDSNPNTLLIEPALENQLAPALLFVEIYVTNASQLTNFVLEISYNYNIVSSSNPRVIARLSKASGQQTTNTLVLPFVVAANPVLPSQSVFVPLGLPFYAG